MNAAPRDPVVIQLQRDLAGAFTARARGFFASEFALLRRDGAEFGRLRMRGLSGAEFEAGDLRATIERTGRRGAARYRMLAGDRELLVAAVQKFTGTMNIVCEGIRFYEARTNLIRNTAVARPSGVRPADGEIVRLEGNLSGRSYEASLKEGAEDALPVAVFLLYHSVALRRRAFRAWPAASREGGVNRSP